MNAHKLHLLIVSIVFCLAACSSNSDAPSPRKDAPNPLPPTPVQGGDLTKSKVTKLTISCSAPCTTNKDANGLITDITLPQGVSKQLDLVATLEDGLTATATTLADWATTNQYASVGNGDTTGAGTGAKGLVTAKGVTGTTPGAATITATYTGPLGSPAQATVKIVVSDAELLSFEVSAPKTSIAKKMKLQYTATGIFTDNSKQNLSAQSAWESTNTSVAAVDSATGLVTAGIPGGPISIVAKLLCNSPIKVSGAASSCTTQKASASQPLSVSNKTLTALSISPETVVPALSVPAGSTLYYTATGTYSDNTSEDLTNAVRWTPASASNNDSTSSVNASVPVVVCNSGDDHDLKQTDGSYIPDAKGCYTVGSNAPDIPGKAKANSASAVEQSIVATIGEFTPASKLKVLASEIKAIVLSRIPSGNVPVGTCIKYKAVGMSTDGSAIETFIENASATRAVADPGVFGFSDSTACSTSTKDSGFAGLPGTTNVSVSTTTASGKNIFVSDTLTVTNAILKSVQIIPAGTTLSPVSILKGQKIKFRAIGTYTDGTQQDVTAQAIWSGFDQTLLTVSNASDGTVGTALAALNKTGTTSFVATIAQTAGAVKSSPVFINVTDAAISGIEIRLFQSCPQGIWCWTGSTDSSTKPKLPQGIVGQLVAVASLGNGTTTDLTEGVNWKVSGNTLSKDVLNPNALCAEISTLDNTKGRIIGKNANVNTSTKATTDCEANVSAEHVATGNTATRSISVTKPIFTAISVTSPTPKIAKGGYKVQLKATGLYSAASVCPGDTASAVALTCDLTKTAKWDNDSSNNTQANAIATVDKGLMTTGPDKGTVLMSAVMDAVDTQPSVEGSLPISVTNALLTGITITPATATVGCTSKQQYAATGAFSDGSVLDLSTQGTWSAATAAGAAIAGFSDSNLKNGELGTADGKATAPQISGGFIPPSGAPAAPSNTCAQASTVKIKFVVKGINAPDATFGWNPQTLPSQCSASATASPLDCANAMVATCKDSELAALADPTAQVPSFCTGASMFASSLAGAQAACSGVATDQGAACQKYFVAQCNSYLPLDTGAASGVYTGPASGVLSTVYTTPSGAQNLKGFVGSFCGALAQRPPSQ